MKSPLGLGMAALGRPGYINLNRKEIFDIHSQERSIATMQNQANTVMNTLFEECNKHNIIPWIDCARSYGLSEKFVGEFLRQNNIPPDSVYVSSKWGYTYVADWNVTLEEGKPHEVKDHSVDNFLKQLEQTKSLIGEYVDLYQVHSATFQSGVLTNKQVHEALYQCKVKNGWKLGLSVSGTVQNEIIREAMKITVDGGKRLFDSVQCTFNILEQKPLDALVEAHEAGMEVIIKEGMANGRVLQSERIQQLKNILPSEFSADQIALACILAQPFSPHVLSGAVTSAQLCSNFGAIKLAEMFKTELKPAMDQIMKESCMESEKYWDDRSALSWN